MKKSTLLFFTVLILGIAAKAQSPATYFPAKWNIGTSVLRSCSGKFTLIYQNDGNLVLYKNTNKPIWATMTNGKSSNLLTFQTDGNLVIYNYNNPIWGAQCHNKGGRYIILQDDGNLVVYTADNRPIWASDTGGL